MRTFKDYKDAHTCCKHCVAPNECGFCDNDWINDSCLEIECPECSNFMTYCSDECNEEGMFAIESDRICTACGFNMKVVKTKTQNIDNVYSEIIENIRLKIVSDYGSVAKFCQEKGFNASVLSRVFNRAQNLSLTHYIKILVSLGVLTPGVKTNFDANLTVIDYLKIDHNSVNQSFLTMVIG